MAQALDDLVIDQGTTWAWAYQWMSAAVAASDTLDPLDTQPDSPLAPVDLTGWTGSAQVRGRYGATEAFATWSTDLDLVGAAAPDGVDGAMYLRENGQILLTLLPQTSAAWKWWRRGPVPWDLELRDPDGNVIRLIEGTALLRAEVTTRG